MNYQLKRQSDLSLSENLLFTYLIVSFVSFCLEWLLEIRKKKHCFKNNILAFWHVTIRDIPEHQFTTQFFCYIFISQTDSEQHIYREMNWINYIYICIYVCICMNMPSFVPLYIYIYMYICILDIQTNILITSRKFLYTNYNVN